MLLLFPAFLVYDLRRRASNRTDLMCCTKSSESSSASTRSRQQQSVATVAGGLDPAEANPGKMEAASLKPDGNGIGKCKDGYTLKWFAKKYYTKWLGKSPVKIAVLIVASVASITGLYGLAKMEDGLSFLDIAPRGTSAYEFLKAQADHFGFYHMYAVTEGNFEYPNPLNQKILYDYHNAFVRVPNIIKDDDGGLNDFWLPLFRNWLVQIQNAFDDDYARGNIGEREWYANASAEGILGFKLLVQTGHPDHPVDETLLHRNRLVDVHGMITQSAFYNYLSAWYGNDALAVSHAQGNLVPQPVEWLHDARDHGLIVPKSMPITYAEIPFYLHNLGNSEVMVEMISQVRTVCSKFEDRGLPNFPRGVPFTFWEQYVNLRMWLGLGLAAIMAAIFIVVSFCLMSVWTGCVIVVVIASIVIQLLGVMGLLGIKMSAVPAVILILAAGIGLELTIHIMIVSENL